jgi:hypothetical protein
MGQKYSKINSIHQVKCPISILLVFKKPEVVHELRRRQDNFVLVSADKASNNAVFVKATINIIDVL